MPDEIPDDMLIEHARSEYGHDDLNIDDGAVVSRADDGAWVAAWVWVPYSDFEE